MYGRNCILGIPGVVRGGVYAELGIVAGVEVYWALGFVV